MPPKGIAISGPPGAGTTTVAKLLAQRLGLKYANAGIIFRKLAEEYGMDVIQFQDFVSKNPQIDYEIDKRSAELLREGGYVVEGRLSAHMAVKYQVKDVLKIYLKAPLDVRAQRLSRRENIPLEDSINEIKIREKKERDRYLKIYNIDVTDLSIYDVILNTENLLPEDIVDVIVLIWERWKSNEK